MFIGTRCSFKTRLLAIAKRFNRFVQSVDIRPAIKSDHNAISLKLLLSKQNNGPGYWKFSSSLIQDSVYKEKIKGVIQDVKLEGEKCKLYQNNFYGSYVR